MRETLTTHIKVALANLLNVTYIICLSWLRSSQQWSHPKAYTKTYPQKLIQNLSLVYINLKVWLALMIHFLSVPANI